MPQMVAQQAERLRNASASKGSLVTAASAEDIQKYGIAFHKDSFTMVMKPLDIGPIPNGPETVKVVWK